ncbi:MAG: winged helix-turn-helix domain-containing protein [archaeon GB-1867-035]|nr:winged helix-turn-helix domain-containing protein [Candidatus Culexmicrobium profundum]
MSKIKEYASLCVSRWGTGEFGGEKLGRPDPFTVLSDETRLAITVLLCLKGPLTAKQIADELELSPSTILDHIKKLKNAKVIREVENIKKKYKRERYYDVDILPYFIDENDEISRRIGKYADILKNTALAVFEKCLDELSKYIKDTLMAKHGITLKRDDVKYFIWLNLLREIDEYFYEKGVLKPPLKTPKRHFFYLGLKRR